jgi:putative endonuclease
MALPKPPSLLQRVARGLRMALGVAESKDRDEVGRMGEALAEAELKKRGWEILARNARVPMGEVDIVARDAQGVHVIVEVKSRVREAGASNRSQTMSPFATITARKRSKLRSIARYLAARNGWPPNRVRIDAVAVELSRESDGTLRPLGVQVAQRVA